MIFPLRVAPLAVVVADRPVVISTPFALQMRDEETAWPGGRPISVRSGWRSAPNYWTVAGTREFTWNKKKKKNREKMRKGNCWIWNEIYLNLLPGSFKTFSQSFEYSNFPPSASKIRNRLAMLISDRSNQNPMNFFVNGASRRYPSPLRLNGR